jgi:hypothetical protein
MGSIYSNLFQLFRGVRQGGVLSPYLFSVYIDDVTDSVIQANVGCTISSMPICIILYADDILLFASSVSALQTLLTVCELYLRALDLCINFNKSVCLRVGSRFKSVCNCIVTVEGKALNWVNCVRYLGVFIQSGRQFKCSFDTAKRKFYSAFNAIYGKIGRIASEDVTLSLIRSKCLPCLLYASEVCPINRSEMKSLSFPVTRILFKIFKTGSVDIVRDCQYFFNFPDVEELIRRRKTRFSVAYNSAENNLCKVINNFFVLIE